MDFLQLIHRGMCVVEESNTLFKFQVFMANFLNSTNFVKNKTVKIYKTKQKLYPACMLPGAYC